MSHGDKPGDLRWPPPSTDLEPFELLEIVRDETGRDRWRRDHREPEVPETYREWLPKRMGREAAVEHDELDLFPAAAAPVTVAMPLALPVAVPEPPMPVPVQFGPATTVAVPHAWRAGATGAGSATRRSAEAPCDATTPVAAQPWPSPARRVDAPLSADLSAVALAKAEALAKADVLRLSLVPAPTTSRPAPASAHRTFFVTAERLGLLAAGALMGVVVTLAAVRDWTSDRAGDEAGAVAVTHGRAARPGPTVLAPTIPREPAATAAPAASTTVEARSAAAPPAAVVPLAAVGPAPAQVASRPVATPVPARVEPVRSSPRAAAPIVATAALTPTRAAPASPRAARVASASRPTVSEGPAVLGTVEQYATAWSRLDARATQAIWPSVDRDALVGTFTGIREQRLTLASCKATVVADRAAVTCRGTLRYRPRVGEHSTRTEQGRWTFDLARHDQAWVIASVGRP